VRTRLTAGLVAGLLTVTACGLQARGQPAGLRGTVRIALVNVFSGPMAFQGEYIQNSLQVEVDALNARGGLLGRRLEVVAADDEQNPPKGAELVREQLTDGDVKLLVGPSTSQVALAAKSAINAAQVPNCGLDLTDEVMSNAPFTFRIQEQDQYRIGALLGYLQRGLADVKRIGFLNDGSASGQDYDRQLQEQAPRLGLQYLGGVSVGASGDPRPAMQQLVQKGAQAALLPNDPATAGRSLLAAEQLGLGKQLQLLGSNRLGAYSFALQTGNAVEGLIFEDTIQSYLTDVPDSRWPPLYRSFVSRITGQYGFAANGVEMKGLPTAADCVVEWSRAVRAASSFNGPAVARAWERLDLVPSETVLGARERPGPQNHDGLGLEGIFVYQWAKNGDRWTLKQLT
jgi:ABC-type branched-subunit amino acid transport system substrate-binding protein